MSYFIKKENIRNGYFCNYAAAATFLFGTDFTFAQLFDLLRLEANLDLVFCVCRA